MESTLKSKHVGTLCRVCLTASKNLVDLCAPINEKVRNFDEHWPVFNMLDRVTFQKVTISSKLPSKLCQMCLSFLKIAYEFQEQFYSSQSLLEKVTEEAPVVDTEIAYKVDCGPRAPVELICGDNKFDLNDVLIVEEDKKDPVSYDGFLRNLGSEVTAKFVHKDRPRAVPCRDVEDSVEVTLFNKNEALSEVQITEPPVEVAKPRETRIDASRLKVRKYPNECRVVIQDRETNRTLRTLYECPICSHPFTTMRKMERHIDNTHSAQNYYMCEECGHLLPTRSQWYHHREKHKGKEYKCDFCDKKYGNVSRLRVHLATHENARRHLCYHCGKSFNYAVSLKYHLRLHYDKKFVCNYCGLKYRMSNTLKRHMRTHTKDKPYRCSYCPKTFCSKSEQIAHEMVHTGERPHHCEYCGKGYIKSYNLKEHYLTHSGPHECQFCSKTFIDVKFLKIHMNRTHKEEEIVEIPLDCFL